MDESVLDALADAAMLCRDETAALSDDIGKISGILVSASDSPLAEGVIADGAGVARFLHSAAMSGDAKNGRVIPLREDKPLVKPLDDPDADENKSIMSQSKRYEAPYASVPRVV